MPRPAQCLRDDRRRSRAARRQATAAALARFHWSARGAKRASISRRQVLVRAEAGAHRRGGRRGRSRPLHDARRESVGHHRPRQLGGVEHELLELDQPLAQRLVPSERDENCMRSSAESSWSTNR